MSAFAHVETWVFDLDNTLYPASCRLFDQMSIKMGEYVMQHFGVDVVEANRMRRDLYLRHGTTLRGLMLEHGHEPGDFLDLVHDIDYSPVPHSPDLEKAIAALPGRKLVFTAGTKSHAFRTLDRLGITHHFEDVFDIVSAAYIPKPQREPYDLFLAHHQVDPRRAAFFEDIARNLEVPHAQGMATVLVVDDKNHDAPQLNADADSAYVQHTTNDLAGFLRDLP